MGFPPLPLDDLELVLQHTGKRWEELRGQRLFITGGTGFFGMWLLESFAWANDTQHLGAKAVILTRDPAGFALRAPHLARREDLEFVAGDIRTFVFPPGKFPFIIHAATEASAKLSCEAPDEMMDVICAGTRHVLEFAAQAGVKKFLFTSSGAVYGRQPAELTHISEDYSGAPDPLLAGSAYGLGKRLAETMCTDHARHHGYETKIARCFAFVGPHLPLDAHFAIGNFIRDAMKGESVRVAGDGVSRRSYLYASDLAIWLWTTLFSGGSGRAYNIGSSNSLSIGQVAAAVAGEAPGISVELASGHAPSTAPSHYVPDVRRAAAELGLVEYVALPAAIKKTIKWYRSVRY